MNLVKLTNRLGGPAYVNMDVVQLFEAHEVGSKLHFAKEDTAVVKETPIEILAQLARKKLNCLQGHEVE